MVKITMIGSDPSEQKFFREKFSRVLDRVSVKKMPVVYFNEGTDFSRQAEDILDSKPDLVRREQKGYSIFSPVRRLP